MPAQSQAAKSGVTVAVKNYLRNFISLTGFYIFPQDSPVSAGVETGTNIPQETTHRVLPSLTAKQVNIPRPNTGSSSGGEQLRGRHVTGSSEEDKKQGEEERRLLGGVQEPLFTEHLTPEQEKELLEITVVPAEAPSAPKTSTPVSKPGKQTNKKGGPSRRPRKRSRSLASNSDSESTDAGSQEDAESEGLERPQ